MRELYSFISFELVLTRIDELIRDMKNSTWPLEVRSLGRTLKNWRTEIIAWHKVQISNGPTEGANNLIKHVKRVAFGFRSFRNFRVRVLLRRQAQLVTTSDTHTPLICEVPVNRVDRPIGRDQLDESSPRTNSDNSYSRN